MRFSNNYSFSNGVRKIIDNELLSLAEQAPPIISFYTILNNVLKQHKISIEDSSDCKKEELSINPGDANSYSIVIETYVYLNTLIRNNHIAIFPTACPDKSVNLGECDNADINLGYLPIDVSNFIKTNITCNIYISRSYYDFVEANHVSQELNEAKKTTKRATWSVILALVTIILSLISSFQCRAQEKKPTLMILPSDGWCEQRYFMTSYDNQGTMVKTPNYQQAFLEDSELTMVISKIGGLLTKMGYSLKDAEQETKAVNNRMAEDNVTMSSTSMSSIAESPLDMIKRRAKMDILIQIWWKINHSGSGNSVSFTIEAFDSYTSKRIATSTGTGKASSDPIPELLEKAVKSHLKEFDKQLMAFYKDISINGREVVLSVRRWESWENTLEYEINGEELTDIIRKWVRKNSVNGIYNLSDATENMMQFEQVRIPLTDEEGDGMDARMFIDELRKYLSKEFGITSKVLTRGLGEGILVIGEK